MTRSRDMEFPMEISTRLVLGFHMTKVIQSCPHIRVVDKFGT
jgi:hypothetical protein